ncbi:GNAT family N-acetyltransferase [Planococcus shixiaomingii]|uniref:GNAT family N-acetyltransferase n=1 Tax=Planococcus shixiaomingii TaxID=3058393 RepID=UPI002609F66E|nr:GNAT family protein [Planococcus sp. N022]WKA54613.1 GNAT family protein [Planococcus sp. N022]
MSRKEVQKMQLWRNEMNEEFAKEILGWKYAKPYDFYNNDVTEERLREMLDGSYSVLVDDNGKLIGFFCTGFSAQVPIGIEVGAYDGDGIDIGLGMKPELTGRGHGSSFFSRILELVGEKKNELPLRLTVAAFNERAIRLYEKLGFEKESEFSTSSTKFITMVQEER